MIVISPAEFRSNLKKYLDIAKDNEIVVIQRSCTEVYELVKRKPVITNEDLRSGITGQELIAAVTKRIEAFPEK